MKKKLLLFFNLLVLLNPIMGQNWLPDTDTATAQEPDEFGTVTDKDGNVYQTARFGDTWCMLENLRCKTFNYGTPLYSFDDIEATRPHGHSYCLWFV